MRVGQDRSGTQCSGSAALWSAEFVGGTQWTGGQGYTAAPGNCSHAGIQAKNLNFI